VTDDSIAYYTGLLDRYGLNAGMCWTVVESFRGPISIEDVAAYFGADPADITEMPWDAAFSGGPSGDPVPVAHLLQAGPAVMTVEVNGFQGASACALSRLSQTGRAHSAYWNINALSSLNYAAYGYLLVTFEGLGPDAGMGIDVCVLDDELGPLYEALHTPGMSVWPAMMAIMEQRTGARLEERWLTASQPAVVLPDQYRPGKSGQSHCFADPDLEATLLLAPPSADDAFVRELAELLIPAGQLASEPEILSSLAALGEGVPRGDARYAPLEQLTSRLRAASKESPASALARRRLQSAWALQLAVRPPDHTPRPLHALHHARLALGDDWLAARRRLRSSLRRG
jgi:hypothetical protein